MLFAQIVRSFLFAIDIQITQVHILIYDLYIYVRNICCTLSHV
jgi:hypothetical protein